MYKKYYSNFLSTHSDKIHLAAHSHYFWPDVTKEAVIKSWEDSCKYSDDKWGYLFETVLPESFNHIKRILNLRSTSNIAFAQNTHELLSRLLSCFYHAEDFTILTTTSEFHSFSRQLKRLLELKNIKAIIIDNEKDSFEKEFLSHVPNADFIFISHVFYNSGLILSDDFLNKAIALKKETTPFCLDGYHGFCAIPTDLSPFEDKIFYLSGGYKYAQAGEGACFMIIPKDCNLRPLNTGWFASFETLSNPGETVEYSTGGMRFLGATQELTPWYRFNASQKLFKDEGISVKNALQYVKKMQKIFIENISTDFLIEKDLTKLGYFLTFDFEDSKKTGNIHTQLKEKNILTDFRGCRLRFGFSLYLNEEDVIKAANIFNSIT